MKSRLEKNDIEIYSTYLEEKSVVVETFIRTKKNKIYKYMTSILKNVYIDKLSEIVKKMRKCMDPIDVKLKKYINLNIEILNF